MRQDFYHIQSGRAMNTRGSSAVGRRLLWCIALLPFVVGLLPINDAYAQTFFNLTAEEVEIDSMLPRFVYSRPIGAAYADSVYTVSIDYPEYIDMSEADIARYHAITDAPLPAEPVIEQYMGVERKKGVLRVGFVPLVCRDGRYQKLVSFMLKVESAAVEGARASRRQAESGTAYADSSVLVAGTWAKIRVPSTGVYQLSDALIRKAGFSNPARVKIYGYGGALQPERLTFNYLMNTDDLKEVPVCEVNGRRLFHAVGPVNWSTTTTTTRTRNSYSDYGYYFLTENDGEPLRVDSATFVGAFYPSPNDYHSLYEKDEYSWFHGGRNLFESEVLTAGTPRTYTLPASSTEGTLTVAMTYNAFCKATVTVNGEMLSTNIEYSDKSGKGVTEIDKYSVAAETVWTFPVNNLGETNTIAIEKTSGGDMRVDYVAITSKEPAASPRLSSDNFDEPEYVYHITNQNHHADTSVDMVIIIPTTQKLLAQAERLKALHEGRDSMRVRIVPADELFNEFSSGTPDANAYRRYMKMLYDRAATDDDCPKFLLLFGDSGWDNRMVSSNWRNYSPDDFLLCYESENSFSETACYVSDDYFGMLDDGEGGNMLNSDMADVAIGRFPVRSDAEAKIMVDKCIAYRNNEYAGAWQNTLCFMGDDGNQNQHMDDAEKVAAMVQAAYPSFNFKRIYWDAYTRATSATGNTYPDAARLINQQMQNGALVMNYTGHGAPHTISHERVINLSDFEMSSAMKLPVWVTASCDIMPFDGQEENIGETAILNKDGGAIAFYGTTRTVYSFYNRFMNMAFMKHLFTSTNGVRNSIGEAVRQAKNELIAGKSDQTTNKLQYTLLGDPALVVAAPTIDIVVDSINGRPAATETAALKAGETVTVVGHIADAPTFNGVVTIIVRDVEETVICKMNDKAEAEKPFEFKDRPNTLYTGSDSVRNGRFTITFALPKDISYAAGKGLITAYAVDNTKTMEAHGQNGNFTMGSDDVEQNDGVGPSIYCYLNGPNFTNGGNVNATPYFYAELSDKDGINASGSGIGHDLELIIDGDMAKTYSLNDQFEYNFGDYRSGRVGYSIPALDYGPHKLLFRAWDVLNNSSAAELTFNVVKGLQPMLLNVECTHNPAVTTTTFIVSHDRIGSEIDLVLEIYDMSGRKLWSHAQSGVSTDSSFTLDWDLTIDGGRRLQTGVYLYRVLVSSDGSSQASKAKKLIVMKN